MATTTTTTPAVATTTATTGNLVGAGVGLVAGGGLGFGIAHFTKLGAKPHWTMIMVVALGALGAYVGYNN